MSDKRKQTLRTHFGPSLHATLISEFTALLETHRGEFAVDYLLDVLTSKYVGPDTDPADIRKARAIEKWLKTELRNAKTNQRLCTGPHGSEQLYADFGYATSDQVIELAARFIRKVIGVSPPRSLMGSFSGGASTRVKRGAGAIARKFMGQADVTCEAWPYILPSIVDSTVWFTVNPEVLNPRYVDGNVMFTVPKRTDIDRVACKEPELNMFAQKAVGDYIRRQLKRHGINLNDQSINQGLAREGSKDGKLATIDLSSASDSVSTHLVCRLLPPGWFILLDAIRSKRTWIDGACHENEMFSSMGNGFTFELESMIFWALARAIAYFSGIRGRISVYGDDIIVPTCLARRLARAFNFFGFTVNAEKSMWVGRFRESCGGHYYRGYNVTPFYVKEPITTVERLIHFLNRLRKWTGQSGLGICDPRYFDFWVKYAKLVDRRLYGGDNLADPRQLVSRHKPRFKLAPKKIHLKREEEALQDGLYLQASNVLSRRAQGQEIAPEQPPDGSDLSELLKWLDAQEFGAPSVLERQLSDWVLRRLKARRSASVDFPVWHTPEGKYL